MTIAHNLLLDKTNGLGRSLERRTVKDVIVDKIAALIASGVLAAGDELPGERELASALAVSRQTVRNAVQTLAARGVLEVAHGLRTRVARADLSAIPLGITSRLNVDLYDIDAVHAARLLIEQQVVADAALHIDDAALDILHRSLKAQADCLDDPVRFLICDREFHVTIYRACANPLLADIVTDLYTYMMEHRRRVLSQAGEIASSFADHQAILQALAAHEPQAAMAAFAGHEERIYASTRHLLSVVATGEN